MIANARDNAFEINLLHSDITDVARDLFLSEQTLQGRELRFVLSCMRICDALKLIHNSAVEIASNTMRFWGNGGDFALTDFPGMGDSANRLVQSCAASLTKEEIEPAQMVLYADRYEREFVNTFYEWHRSINPTQRTQAHYALAITRHLSQIVQQTREIADAVVFWLDDIDAFLAAQKGEIGLLDQLNLESIQAAMAAMPQRH
jgi:phosphate uptake regulator